MPESEVNVCFYCGRLNAIILQYVCTRVRVHTQKPIGNNFYMTSVQSVIIICKQ